MKMFDISKQYHPKLLSALQKGVLKGFDFNESMVPVQSVKYPAVSPYYWTMKMTSRGKNIPFYKRFFYASQSLCSLIVYYKSNNLIRARLGTGMIVSPSKSDSYTFVVSSANCTEPTIEEEGKTFHLNKIKIQVSGVTLDVNSEIIPTKVVYRRIDDIHNFSILKIKSSQHFPGKRSAFFIPSPVKEILPCSNEFEYNHLLMAVHPRVSEESVKKEDYEYLTSLDTSGLGPECMLGESNACSSFGEVFSVDKDSLICRHSSCTIPGSSGGASLVINPFDLDSATVPPFETPLFSGIQLGGSNNLNISYVVDNDEFKQQYAKHVVDNFTSDDWEDMSPVQKAAIQLFLKK
ncbi:hypothetical protein ABK040_012538 [Willaertia magna]